MSVLNRFPIRVEVIELKPQTINSSIQENRPLFDFLGQVRVQFRFVTVVYDSVYLVFIKICGIIILRERDIRHLRVASIQSYQRTLFFRQHTHTLCWLLPVIKCFSSYNPFIGYIVIIFFFTLFLVHVV